LREVRRFVYEESIFNGGSSDPDFIFDDGLRNILISNRIYTAVHGDFTE
jgi:hypothetical protein